MRKLLGFAILFAIFATSSAYAQTTNITLQVTDAGGTAWTGPWSVTLVSLPGAQAFGPPFYNINTTTNVPNQMQSGTLSGTGSASMTLTQNIGIVPVNSQWKFTVCTAQQNANGCYSQFVTITAATSVTLTPPTAILITTATPGGALNPSSLNNIIFVDGVTYPCTSIGINNAIAAAIALGGGRVDANACRTLSSYTTEIDVGNAAGVPVALFLPQGNSGGTPSWNANITDGVSYALKVFNNSSAIGYTTTYGSFFIAAGASANMGAVCGNAASVANEHVRMEGFSCGVYGGSPTIVKAIGYFHGLADTAVARNMTFEDYSATATLTKIFWVWNACCAGTFEYVTAEASGISGVTPCYFGNGNTSNGGNLGTGFDHLACVHPGSGASNIQDDEWAQYTGAMYSNIYLEMAAGADTTTPWISITSNSTPTAADTFVGVTAGGDVASSTRYLFKIASGAKASIFSAKQGTVSTNAVNDLNTGVNLVRPINSTFSYTTEPSRIMPNVNTFTFSTNTSVTGVGGASGAGTTFGFGFIAPFPGAYGHLCVNVTTADAVNSYEFGVYNATGTLLAHTTAGTLPSTGNVCLALNATLVIEQGAEYVFASSALTVNTARFINGVNVSVPFNFQSVAASVFPASISVPGGSYVLSDTGSNPCMAFYLYP